MRTHNELGRCAEGLADPEQARKFAELALDGLDRQLCRK